MVTNGWFAQDPGDSQDAVFRASWNNLVTPWGLSYSGYLFHFSDPPVHKDTRNSSVPATTTQLADIIVFWHSVNKGSRNLCALLAWESVQKPLCLLCSAFAGLPVKIGAGGGDTSFSGELAGRIPSAICTAYKMSKRESSLLHQCKPPMGSSTSAYF